MHSSACYNNNLHSCIIQRVCVQIYDVCERHGRIAYRRADGSRLITANDHWKSQVRHALYTGGRFQRVSSNADFWQLAASYSNATAELVRVLVRADDPTVHIKASISLMPHAAHAESFLEADRHGRVGPREATNTHRKTQQSLQQGRSLKGRRKRTVHGCSTAATDQASGGDVSANVYHGTGHQEDKGHATRSTAVPTRFQPARQKRMRRPALLEHHHDDDDDIYLHEDGGGYGGAPDDHSILDDEADNDNETPRNTAIANRARIGASTDPRHRSQREEQGRPSTTTIDWYQERDPAELRWGATAYRSTIILTANDSISFSPGKTPIMSLGRFHKVNQHASRQATIHGVEPQTTAKHCHVTDDDERDHDGSVDRHTRGGHPHNHRRRAGSSEADSMPSPPRHPLHAKHAVAASAHAKIKDARTAAAIASEKLPLAGGLTIPPPLSTIAIHPSMLQQPSSVARASPDFPTVETPNDCKDAAAHATPPLMLAQWTHVMRQLQESSAGSVAGCTPTHFAQTYWPGILAAAAAAATNTSISMGLDPLQQAGGLMQQATGVGAGQQGIGDSKEK